MTEGYHTHQYSDENQEAAFEFLDHFNQLSARHSLAAVKELDEKALQCTRTGQVMLDFEDAKPLLDEIRDYYMEHKGQPVHLSGSSTMGKAMPALLRGRRRNTLEWFRRKSRSPGKKLAARNSRT